MELESKEAVVREAIARSQRDSDEATQRLKEVASLKEALVSSGPCRPRPYDTGTPNP